MASLEEALQQKTAECENIQRSFDDYVESSKELETELETALAEAEAKIVSLNKKKAAADDKVKELTDKNNQLSKDYNKCYAELTQLKESSGGFDQLKRELENANEDLNNRVRILEATEEDLKHKLSNMEEDMIFLQGDLNDLNVAKTDMEVTFNQERESFIFELEQARIAHEDQPLDANSIAMVEKLKSDLADTQQALADMTAQNVELKEELSKAFLEVYELQEKVQNSAAASTNASANTEQLEREIAFLNQQLDVKNTHLQDLLKGEECSELREMATLMDEKDVQLEKMRGEIEAYIETSNLEKMALVAEMEEKIRRMTSEMSALRAENVSKSITDKMSKNGGGRNRQIQVSKSKQSMDVTEKTSEEFAKLITDLESTRKGNAVLLSKLQALLGNIQVCCRTRPPSEQELVSGKICVDVADDNEVMIYDSRVEQWKTFMFDRVWNPDAQQIEVFSDVEPVIVSVADGFNACILAYGQTGSGKTYTMDGYADQRGVSYRTIQKLFDVLNFRKTQYNNARNISTSPKSKKSNNSEKSEKSEKAPATKSYKKLVADSIASQSQSFEFMNPLKGKSQQLNIDPMDFMMDEIEEVAETEEEGSGSVEDEEDSNAIGYEFTIELSMMEIYNEQLYDLLNPTTGGGQSDGVSLDIRQGADNVIVVPGMTQIVVNSIEDVLSVVSKGNVNRATASTNLNEHSSRSHLIIVVEVTVKLPDETPIVGKLHLVDLAGSERVGKSGVTGAAMKEAQYINKSLSALGDVMEALDQKSKHIPYRNSKLTYLLQNSLGGNSRTMMIVTVCPTDLTFDETLFTLQFATRVRNITMGPAQKNSNTKNLEVALKTLKVELKEMKTKRKQQDDIITELKKEVRKVGDRTAVPDSKLKASEEAKKAAETLLQQATKQLSELNALFNEEKESKDQIVNDLKLTQRNLKKANDYSKEQQKEQEKLQGLLKTKEITIEELNTKTESLRLENLAIAAALAEKSSFSNKMNRETSTITPILNGNTPEKPSVSPINMIAIDSNGAKKSPNKDLPVSPSSAWRSPVAKSPMLKTNSMINMTSVAATAAEDSHKAANGESKARNSTGGATHSSNSAAPTSKAGLSRTSWSSFRTNTKPPSPPPAEVPTLARKPSIPVFSNTKASTSLNTSNSSDVEGEKSSLARKSSLPSFSVKVVTDVDKLNLTSPKSDKSGGEKPEKQVSPKKPPLPSFGKLSKSQSTREPPVVPAPERRPPVPETRKSTSGMIRTSSDLSLQDKDGKKPRAVSATRANRSDMTHASPIRPSPTRAVKSTTNISTAAEPPSPSVVAPIVPASPTVAPIPAPVPASAPAPVTTAPTLVQPSPAVQFMAHLASKKPPQEAPAAIPQSTTEEVSGGVHTSALRVPAPVRLLSEPQRVKAPSPLLAPAMRAPSPSLRPSSRTSTHSEDNGASKIPTPAPTIGARSEEALKRHQARMEKKRLELQQEKERQLLS